MPSRSLGIWKEWIERYKERGDLPESIEELLRRVESVYMKRLPRAWSRDPEQFAEYVNQLEKINDLRRKMSNTH